MAAAQAIGEHAESEAQSIKTLAVTEAKNVTEQAQKDAEAEIQAAKDKASEEANQLTNAAEQKVAESQAEVERFSEEKKKIEFEIEQAKKQLRNVLNVAAKFPKKKIFSLNTFTIDKETYDALMDALEYHIGLVNNTLTSDEDRQAAADERKRQEEITANMEQEVQQRAIIEIQPYIDELEEEKKEYEKRREKADQTILNMANRTANRILSDYAKLTKEEKKKLLIPAYTAEKRELQKTDDFEILF